MKYFTIVRLSKGKPMLKNRHKMMALGFSALLIACAASQGASAATGGPKDSVITLQSPFLDSTNTWDAKGNQQMADGWVAKGWFGSGLIFQVSFAPVGSTINLTYNVADKSGKPLSSTPVNLRINKGYSESASIVEVDGIKTKGIDRPPFDQANVIHRTDYFGNVTFAMKNLDLESSAEPEPASYTEKPIFSEDKLDRLHSQVLPEVNSEPADHSVISEFHYFKPKSVINVPTTKPTVTLVTPKLTDSNSVLDKTRNIRQAYAPLGGDIVVVYKVTGDDGRAAPGKVLNLQISGGKSTLQATTDAFGYAAFTLKNADSKPNAAPTSATAAMPTSSSSFATLKPEVSGATATTGDGVEFHYFRGVSATFAKEGKSFVLSVAIAGANGKSVAIDVTGAKSKKLKISSALQQIPFTVSAGTKSVVVTIDGKKYTTKVNVK
jgi:hypothetical protein